MTLEYNGYRIIGDGTFGQKLIQNIGRGSLPLSLRGSFTSVPQAQRAIDVVITEKGDKNGTTSERKD